MPVSFVMSEKTTRLSRFVSETDGKAPSKIRPGQRKKAARSLENSPIRLVIFFCFIPAEVSHQAIVSLLLVASGCPSDAISTHATARIQPAPSDIPPGRPAPAAPEPVETRAPRL